MLHPKKIEIECEKTCVLKDDDPFQRAGIFFQVPR